MAEYNRRPNRLLLRGMNLTMPGNRLGQEWAQLLENVRSYRLGEWRQRPGLTRLVDTAGLSPLLWARRINDSVAGTSKVFFGSAAGDLYDEAAAVLDSGYGPGGYSAVIARPDASPAPYMFVGNAQRQSKLDAAGARTEWGLAAPTAEPQASLELPVFATITKGDDPLDFTASGGALSAQTRVSTTIANILYDTGSAPGWASIQPVVMSDQWQVGMMIDINGGLETTLVERVFQAIKTTTIGLIVYDSGATGECCVQLTVPTLGLERDMLLLLDTEPVRVLNVTEGLDGVPSFRCSTVGTHAAGETVTGLQSFRVPCTLLHAVGEALTFDYVQLAAAGAGFATSTQTGPFDLSHTVNGANRPMQGEDFVHISVRVDDWSLVTEIQLQFDIDASTNDFAHNYYFYAIRPPDLLAAVQQTASSLTAQQQSIQRQQIDDLTRQQLQDERQQLQDALGAGGFFEPTLDDIRTQRIAQIDSQLSGFTTESGQGPLSSQGSTGTAQWTEFKIPLQEFHKVGADQTRGWKDVFGWRLSVNTTAAVDVGFNALWIGGTGGPDWAPGQISPPDVYAGGLNYIYRFRNSQTGSVSAWSAPMRSAIFPHRQGVNVTGQGSYPDAQADMVDFARIGGTLGSYYIVGSAPASAPTLLDLLDDSQASRNELAVFDHFRPWVTTDLPQSGTCSVVGSSVLITAGTLNLDYTRLNQIIINGQVCSFYANPSTTTQVFLNESLGTLSGVTWEMPNPTMEGQPLPVVFGPYAGSSGEFLFGLGDPINPGILYFTLGNDPEGQSDAGYIELATPSEPLIGGCVLDGRIFVWSDHRAWIILPSFEGGASGAGSLFYPQETSMGRGLAGPWAVCAGDQLYWVAPDGVWSSPGQSLTSLTDESLSPLFRHDGTDVADAPFQGTYPFDFGPAALPYLSLTYSRDGLYLVGQDTTGALQSFFFSFLTRGWVRDSLADAVTRWVREDGEGVDVLLALTYGGLAHTVDGSSTTDDGAFFDCTLVTRAEDWDDFRAQHQVGDVAVDIAPGGATVSATLQIDSNTSSLALAPITGTARQLSTLDINSGLGTLARDVALALSWSTQGGRALVYAWEPAALIKAALSLERATDWADGGYTGNKWLQGVRLRIDTYGSDKTLRIETDGGTVLPSPASFTINSNGEGVVVLSFDPVVTHLMRLVGDDTQPWRVLAPPEWIFEPEPESALWWETQFTNLDQPGYLHVHDILLPYRSSGDARLFVSWDGAAEDSYLMPSSAGERTKLYIPLLAKKGKLVAFRIVPIGATPLAVYMADLEVRAKPWGVSGSQYQILKPFGDISRTQGGARV